MKPYGHSKDDIGKSCPYGCCTGKSDKRRSIRDVRDRAKRKAARQDGKAETRFVCDEPIQEVIYR